MLGRGKIPKLQGFALIWVINAVLNVCAAQIQKTAANKTVTDILTGI
jgi:hypothetical protein